MDKIVSSILCLIALFVLSVIGAVFLADIKHQKRVIEVENNPSAIIHEREAVTNGYHYSVRLLEVDVKDHIYLINNKETVMVHAKHCPCRTKQ